MFVSDALPEDIVAHVAWIRAWHRDGEMEDDRRVSAEMRAIGEELEASLALGAAGGGPGSTALVPHHFLSSPHAFWDMPADLRAELGGADLVIVKGDGGERSQRRLAQVTKHSVMPPPPRSKLPPSSR